ncbi:type IV secretion system protein PtlA [Bordetella bronchiseptica]|uniref:Pertussis toxin transport protein n=2 Tax=Bordetella bronchiseptica TaxID=518 RepID=A0A0C6PA20_BORBO|nr:type IV secretion system protein PtlA [Bordetella bronchiseptica]SHP86515.1 TrbC/VIRB2 family [Mycobacteroides abscessus subsp. abscessus]AWP77356.1 type IV secretion system protein VirB2 [Bordetella bronchiseptica]AWP87014.1 type IV secretion system protein VirB2 [Bordetella bronchiseptica]AWQ12582.1 type IV secretion system protein VirB2 [Bordetella bronchiseptica]AZW14946.1 type IV secretion system protein VirB2 [Bordetella bronchiseptica]
MNPLKDLRTSLPRLAFMAACALLSATLPDLAQAGGGLQRVNHFMASIVVVLRGASVATVTIAIIWAGYKLLFRHADVLDVVRVVLAGLLIGASAEIARYLLT